MVGVEGFEPPTLWSQTRCATKLRYTPTLPAFRGGLEPVTGIYICNSYRYESNHYQPIT